MNLFEAKNYTEWIEYKIQENSGVRAYRTQLARAARVHPSYFSRALRGVVHLNPDQGLGLSQYWGLSANEQEYFLTLIHLARASSREYHAMLNAQLEKCRSAAQKLSSRFDKVELQSPERFRVYYSSWYFAAIHMALTIRKLRTPETIAAALKMEPSLVSKSLHSLRELGFVIQSEGEWKSVKSDLHLDPTEFYGRVQHVNWRLKATQKIQESENARNLHYTGIHTLSEDDFVRLRLRIINFLQEIRHEIEPSPEEKLVAFSLDWFEV